MSTPREPAKRESDWGCYDARIASAYLQNPKLFSAIDEISDKIIKLIERPANREHLKSTLSENPKDSKSLFQKIVNELYKSSMFGKLSFRLSKDLNATQLIDNILYALNLEKNNLPLIMHIHQVFMLYFYDNLPSKMIKHTVVNTDETLTLSQTTAQQLNQAADSTGYNKKWIDIKANLVKKIFGNLFPAPRMLSGKDGNPVATVVTSDGSPCPNLATVEPHCSLVGVFSPLSSSDWAAKIQEHNLPFLAGPSGHSGSLLLLASLLGNFDYEQLAQYTAGAIALLCGGGLHTIHEIMTIFEIGGLNYSNPGDYYLAMPDSFIDSPAYVQIQHDFPEHLPPASIDVAKSLEYGVISPPQLQPQFPIALPECSLQTMGFTLIKSADKHPSASLNATSAHSAYPLGASSAATLLIATSLFYCCKRRLRFADADEEAKRLIPE